MTRKSPLIVAGLQLDTAHGRPLLRDLHVSLEAGDRVALIGRNGIGKSTLLRAIASSEQGSIKFRGHLCWVPQHLAADSELSPGQHRRAHLQTALRKRPELLILDEPTQDLDADGVDWLRNALGGFNGTLLVVSHDPRLLDDFADFFVIAEQGCWHLHGSLHHLRKALREQEEEQADRYRRHLARLEQAERNNARDAARRERKKQRGRATELERRAARAVLNSKRSSAQETQAKRRQVREDRMALRRDAAHLARRALTVHLPLSLALPDLSRASPRSILHMENVATSYGATPLWEGITLSLRHQRILITGKNGSGKSTLAKSMVGEHRPREGRVWRDLSRIGYIGQQAENIRQQGSVIDTLLTQSDAFDFQGALQLLQAHRFPRSLASHPLRSLSPGERLRAALLCLSLRKPTPELLILDEPTDSLDLHGQDAVTEFLNAWPGGLVVITHDPRLIRQVRFDDQLALGEPARSGRDPNDRSRSTIPRA